jgi:hypothetical protein
LEPITAINSGSQRFDCLWLITGGSEVGYDLEFGHLARVTTIRDRICEGL